MNHAILRKFRTPKNLSEEGFQLFSCLPEEYHKFLRIQDDFYHNQRFYRYRYIDLNKSDTDTNTWILTHTHTDTDTIISYRNFFFTKLLSWGCIELSLGVVDKMFAHEMLRIIQRILLLFPKTQLNIPNRVSQKPRQIWSELL